jgi:hypothetical protein
MGRHKVTLYSQDEQLKEIMAGELERYGRWAFTCDRSAIREAGRWYMVMSCDDVSAEPLEPAGTASPRLRRGRRPRVVREWLSC